MPAFHYLIICDPWGWTSFKFEPLTYKDGGKEKFTLKSVILVVPLNWSQQLKIEKLVLYVHKLQLNRLIIDILMI